jgi:UDP-galactopyranose mutase
MKYDYLIVGAGFAGSVMAERIATQLNKRVLIVEKRNHIGGNTYDEYDNHGILIHKYGPHIFHTNSKIVFEYLSMFTKWRKYEHKVLASLNGNLYPIPINRITINKLYGRNYSEEDIRKFLGSVKLNRNPVMNSEDIIVNKIGYDLFDKFFKYYTIKQWNHEPKELSPSVCGRIPVRTNDDCRYFTDKYQYMPLDGYTKMFEKMLSHENIDFVLGTDYKSLADKVEYEKIIYTGPIDYFFEYKFGKLPYRSIIFEFENHEEELFQEAAVINFVDNSKIFTRVAEYKYLTSQKSNTTTISKELTNMNGDPFYPILNEENKKLYYRYRKEADNSKNVIFLGRLAEYKYYNMDQVVANSLKLFNKLKSN